jgi:hypothetical protein
MGGFGHESTNAEGCCVCMGGAVAAVAPNGCILALVGTPAWASKAGKTGGDMVTVEP